MVILSIILVLLAAPHGFYFVSYTLLALPLAKELGSDRMKEGKVEEVA
jgi:hypothetical protein